MQTFSGLQYLKIDIANQMGMDKLTWDKRLDWVHGNEKDLETHDNKAKYPILYRKAVRALRAVQRNERTNHIMGLDATASGLQIMAAMSGCVSTAKATNLINTGDRRCIYSTVAQYMNTQGVNVSVEDIKHPVMTVFYGSTAQPKNLLGEGPELVAFYKTLREKLAGPFGLMELFQNQWKSGATHHTWTMPDKHVAHVPVTKTVEKYLEIDELEHMKFAYRSKIITPQPRGRSLAANIVHSVDGWIVRQMVTAAEQQGFWMAPIHDCFYTSPNYIGQVRDNYLKILTHIAKSPLVEGILSEIAGYYVPYQKESFNLDQRMSGADYALS